MGPWRGCEAGNQIPLLLACVLFGAKEPRAQWGHVLPSSGDQLHSDPLPLARPCLEGSHQGGVLQGCGCSLPPVLPSTAALIPAPPWEECREPTAREPWHTAHQKGLMLAATFGVYCAMLVPTPEGIECPVPRGHSSPEAVDGYVRLRPQEVAGTARPQE